MMDDPAALREQIARLQQQGEGSSAVVEAISQQVNESIQFLQEKGRGDLASFVMGSEIRLREQIARLQQDRDQWRDAIIDACMVDGIFTKEHEVNPRKAVNDLLAWSEQMVLDPAVSQPARDLHERLEAAKAACVRLRQVLLSLANEATGFLSMASVEDHGHTNIAVLQQKIINARAALTGEKETP